MNREQRNQLTKNIQAVLEKNPNARDNDALLYFICIESYYYYGNIIEAMINKTIPSYESITRLSRMLKKKYPGLQGIKNKERIKKAEEVRKQFSKKKIDQTEEIWFYQPKILLGS